MTGVRLKTSLAASAALLSLAFPAASAAKGADRDHDRMPDRWERKHKLDAGANDAARDRDRDGLRNLAEYRAKTNPAKADSDRDGVLDSDEDRDRDRVDNANEDRERTSPAKRDTDRDGVRDGAEDADSDGLDNRGEDETGNDPIDSDSDDDGVRDGDEDAGRVESFVGGVLVVRLAGGGTVSGRVDEDTEIECKTEADHESWDDEDADDSRKSRALDVRGRARRDFDEDDEDWGDDLLEDYDDDESCGPEALVAGAIVHEAELELVDGGAVFSTIELVE